MDAAARSLEFHPGPANPACKTHVPSLHPPVLFMDTAFRPFHGGARHSTVLASRSPTAISHNSHHFFQRSPPRPLITPRYVWLVRRRTPTFHADPIPWLLGFPPPFGSKKKVVQLESPPALYWSASHGFSGPSIARHTIFPLSIKGLLMMENPSLGPASPLCSVSLGFFFTL